MSALFTRYGKRSRAPPRGELPLLGVREDARLSEVDPAHRPYLSFHRDRVFVRRDGQG